MANHNPPSLRAGANARPLGCCDHDCPSRKHCRAWQRYAAHRCDRAVNRKRNRAGGTICGYFAEVANA